MGFLLAYSAIALVLGAGLGAVRALRPANIARLVHISEIEDALTVLLVWVGAVIAAAMIYQHWALSTAGSTPIEAGAAAALATPLSAGLLGVLVGESLRARLDGTASPLTHFASALFDTDAWRALAPSRRPARDVELRMAAALYLFDASRPSAQVWRVLEPHLRDVAEDGNTDRLLPGYRRLARFALAFDDLRLHGLGRRPEAVARDILGDLGRMARELGCTEPATLADLRLIGRAMGLDAGSVRSVLLRSTGVSGDWTHRSRAGSTGHETGAKPGPRPGSRSGFGGRTARTAPLTERERHFRALGLAPGASFPEIRRAWRRLAKRYHPDRYSASNIPASERADIERRMREVNAAYEALRG